MKKLFFLLLVLFSFINVNASSLDVISISNKCSVVKDKRIVIPVEVISTRDGVLTPLINEYTLGFVDNQKDLVKVKLDNIDGSVLVSLDYNRDGYGRSLINYYVEDEIKIEKLKKIVTFYVEVQFLKDVPNVYHLLGTDIIISEDEEVCEYINVYEINEITRNVYLENKQADHYEYVKDIVMMVVIIVLVVSLVFCIVLLVKKEKKK